MTNLARTKNKSIAVLAHGDKVFVVNTNGADGENTTVGTIRGYANSWSEDPDEAERDNMEFNLAINTSPHAAYRQAEIRPFVWMTLDGAMVSATPEAPVSRVVVYAHDLVIIEDKVYRVTPTNNHNFALTPHILVSSE